MLKSLVRLGTIACALLLVGAAMAQGVVQQVGPVVPGDAVVWSRNGQIMDGGATAVASSGSYNWTGKQTFGPSATSGATVNVSPGSAPVTPVNGDIWSTSLGLYAAINGATIGPFAGTGNANTFSNENNFSSNLYTGAINSTNVSSNWVETLRPNSVSIAQTTAVSNSGYIGFVSASRSSDNTCSGGCQGSIGAESLENNNNTSYIQTGYAHYFEAQKQVGAGTTQGQETDVANFGSLVAINPLTMFNSGATPVYWSACGGGHTGVNPCSAAFGIVANSVKFDKGIVFGSGSLSTRSDSKQEAISFPSGAAASFYDASGNIIANVYGSGSGTSGTNLNFQSGAATIETLTGSPILTNSGSGVTAYQPIYIANNIGAVYPATGAWGALAWNKSNGGGEVDEFNGYTGATASFNHYQMTGAGAATLLDSLSPQGVYSPAGGLSLSGSAGYYQNYTTPLFSNSTYYSLNKLIGGSITPSSEFALLQSGYAATDALTLGIDVPSSVTNHQVNGIGCYITSHRGTYTPSTVGGDVCLFAQARSIANNSQVFSINTIMSDTVGYTGQFLRNEFDYAVNVAGTTVTGMFAVLNSTVSPENTNAWGCQAVSSPWAACYTTNDGTVSVAASFGALGAGSNQNSQPINLYSHGAGATKYAMILQGDTGGNAIIRSGATGGYVYLQNNAGSNILYGSTTNAYSGGSFQATTYMRPGQTTFAGISTADPSPAVGDMLNIIDASTCTANTAVVAGGGSAHSCAVVYNGAGWMALVTH